MCITPGTSENSFIWALRFKVEYNVQNYPELHAGPIFWMTSYELGFHISKFTTIRDKTVEISLYNSLVALNSRTREGRDPYFFSTEIGENFSDILGDLSLGTFGKYNQTELRAKVYFNGEKRRKAFGYAINLLKYSDGPTFTQVIHQLRYSWFLSKEMR